MTEAELAGLAAPGESERLEFKQSVRQLKEACQTVCAMLNTRGGTVLLGVRNNGALVGDDVTDATQTNIADALRRIQPAHLVTLSVVLLGSGKSVVMVEVPQATQVHSYEGRSYRRVGPSNEVMDPQQLQSLLAQRQNPTERWEAQPAHGISLQDLDDAEVVRTVEEMIRRGRGTDPGTRNLRDLLHGLGLLAGAGLCNAAVVLFGRAGAYDARYPQCRVKLARFRGVSNAEFEDNRQFSGNLFVLLRHAQDFLVAHLPIAGRVIPGVIERADAPIYPPEATREALANAFCHRDYSVAGGDVSIAIYDDRLEIRSTGSLPGGLTPEDLRRGHASIRRNPSIADVLFNRGIVEQWGRGTQLMMSLAQRAGLPEPEFEDRGGQFTVRFRPSVYQPPSLVQHELTEVQQQLLRMLNDHGPTSLMVLARSLGRPKRTVQDNLKRLQDMKLADMTGRGRATRWYRK